MTSAVPRAFHCEHTRAKSRVYALVERPRRSATLHAVRTCTDHALAQHAAYLLSSVLGTWADAPELAATWESLRRGRGDRDGLDAVRRRGPRRGRQP